MMRKPMARKKATGKRNKVPKLPVIGRATPFDLQLAFLDRKMASAKDPRVVEKVAGEWNRVFAEKQKWIKNLKPTPKMKKANAKRLRENKKFMKRQELEAYLADKARRPREGLF